MKNVHHVHMWSISEHSHALEAHIVPRDQSLNAFEAVKLSARKMLARDHEITHATFEACVDADCGPEVVPDHHETPVHTDHEH